MSYHSGQDPEENLPDWLKDLRKRQSMESSKSEDEEAEQTPPEEEPDWLEEIRERYGHPAPKAEEPAFHEPEAEPSDTQPVPPPHAQEEIPQEHEAEPRQEALIEQPEIPLSDTQPVPTPHIEEAIPEEEVAEQKQEAYIEKTEVPEEAKPGEQISETPPESEGEPEAVRREFPDWLQALGDLEAENEKLEEQKPTHIPAFTEGTADLSPGELPSWLEAIRPSGTGSEQESIREEDRQTKIPGSDEGAGPLAGLSDVLPAEPAAIQSIKPTNYTTRIELTDRQNQHIAALKKLLEEEGKSKEEHTDHIAKPSRLLNIFLSAALFLAVLIPLISQSQLIPRPQAEIMSEASKVFAQIDILPAGAPVLVAFDLQPALFGETRAAATAVLTHLLDRGAHLVFISTQPTGPAITEYLLHEQEGDQPAIATGDYTNLGYLSGGMAALRSFLSDPSSATFSVTTLGTNPWTKPALKAIDQVSDFALVVVVSGDAEDVQLWIEQGAEEFTSGLVAVTSAQAAPLLKPYLQSQPQTLRGLLSGVQGAVLYEGLRANEGDGRAMWDAYSFGLGAIILLILLGGLYGRLIQTGPNHPRTGAATTQTKAETSGSQSAA